MSVKKESAEKIMSSPKLPAAAPVLKKKNSATNKNRAHLIMAKLCETYPDADCELVYSSTFQLLTAVILSAQCTDKLVNKVTEKLFAKFPTALALAQADLDEIKTLIKATGYYNAKAKNIQACAQELITRFGGEVPRTREELMTLPGVGRKTANVVLGVANDIPGWSVDTHVQRLCKRLDFSRQSDPYKIELELQKLFPDMDWSKLSITLIWHGRRQCFARKPLCSTCPVKEFCPQAEI
jgi:endonuclease-3